MADRISRNFSRIKLKKAVVKVPELKAKVKRADIKKDSVPVSSIVNILLKAAVEKSKSEIKEKAADDVSKTYILKNDGKGSAMGGGYGTIPKNYGSTPHSSYVDYAKLFSYLGKFKAQGAYENSNSIESLSEKTESGSFVLADKETMDKAGRFDKYIRNPNMAIQTMALSLVPIAGLSSAEWEDIKNLMKFDPVMYTLKSKTS